MNLTDEKIQMLKNFVDFINVLKKGDIEYVTKVSGPGTELAIKNFDKYISEIENNYNIYVSEANKVLTDTPLSIAEQARFNVLMSLFDDAIKHNMKPNNFVYGYYKNNVPTFKKVKSNCGMGLILKSLNDHGNLTRNEIKAILGGTARWDETFAILRKAGLITLDKKVYNITPLGKEMIENVIKAEEKIA